MDPAAEVLYSQLSHLSTIFAIAGYLLIVTYVFTRAEDTKKEDVRILWIQKL